MRVVELVECLMILVASANLPIDVVSGILGLFSNYLNETLEAITFFDLLVEAVVSMHVNCVLLLRDEICELLELGFHPLQLGNIILHIVLGEIIFLVKRL